jgi:hypothetical protein
LLLFAAALAFALPAQAEVKAKLSELGSPSGSGAGQLNTPNGIAVSIGGAGEADPGDFYVADRANHRISQFSASGGFIRAFGLNVVASGPDNVTPTSSVQSVSVPATVTAGTFVLSFNGQSTGGSGAGNLTAGSNIVSSLIAAKGTANLTASSPTVTGLATTVGKFIVGQPVAGAGIPVGTTIIDVSGATLTLSANATATGAGVTLTSIGPRPFAVGQTVSGAGIPAATTITAINAAEGKLTLSANIEAGGTGSEVPLKSGLAFNATAAQVQTALQGLSTIGAANATVTGGPGATLPYTVAFAGALKELPVPLLAADSSGLTGGSVATSMTTAGVSPYEICKAGADTCQAGTATAGPGSINNVMAVAVDQSTGNIYATGNPNRRIDVFSAGGAFQGAFGVGVRLGDTAPFGLDFCTASTGCLAGQNSGVAGALAGSEPSRTLAVDSTGALYVPNPGNKRLDVFSPKLNVSSEVVGASFLRGIGWDVIPAGAPGDTGTGLETCTVASGCQAGLTGGGAGQFATGSPNGVAVDSAGNIYTLTTKASGNCEVAAPCRIQKFNSDGTIANASFGPASGACQVSYVSGAALEEEAVAVAVDPSTQHVFVFKKTGSTAARLCELDSAGSFDGESISPLANLTVNTGVGGGLAVGTAGRVYATNRGPVYILGPVPPPCATILPVTDVTQSTAKLHGEVCVPAPGGEGFDVKYHFEYSSNGVDWISTPSPDATLPTVAAGEYPVEATVQGLDPHTKYSVRLVASTSSVVTSAPPAATFTTFSKEPTIVSAFAEDIGQDKATLAAKVNPHSQATTYHFEWATAKEWSENPNTYPHRIPSFERQLGAGSATAYAQDTLTALSPQSTYHFRIVARNFCHPTGPGDSTPASVPCETASSDRQFETVGANGLPNDRAAELVSPPDKRSGVVGSIAGDNAFQAQASPDGASMIYPLLGGLDSSTSGGNLLEIATRTSSGWQSTQLSAPSLGTPREPINGEGVNPSGVLIASSDGACAVVKSFSSLTPDTPALDGELGLPNLYVWRGGEDYELVTTRVPLNPNIVIPVSGGFRRVAASADCSQVFFKSDYQYLTGSTGLYEWREGDLHDAGILPNGSAAVGDVFMGTVPDNVVSNGIDAASSWGVATADGSLFFSAISNEGPDSGKRAIFLRSDEGASVVDISQSQNPGVAPNGVRFEAATPDGAHAFFRANHGLAGTPGAGTSSNGPTNGECGRTDVSLEFLDSQSCDLYRYDVDTGVLTDISVDLNPVDAATGPSVQGAVAITPDGSRVYLAARGQIVPGKGKTYAENLASSSGGKFGSVNIYLVYGGTVKYVTTLSQQSESVGDLMRVFSGTSLMRSFGWTAATNEAGDRLLFTSISPDITGYDSGGPPEAYLYSEGQGEPDDIVCVSCRRDGLPSAYPSGKVLLPPVPGSRREVRNVTRPRAMSADGRRIFFTSYNRLAPRATEGQKNVYEWENGNVYFLAAAKLSGGSGLGSYLDSSASGDDVFIATSDKLAPQDEDSVSDVYDLKVGGGFQSNPLPPQCQVDETVPLIPGQTYCQKSPTPPPVPAEPGSGGVRPGNAPRKPACSKGAIRRHGKCVSKKHGHKPGKKKGKKSHKGSSK